VLPIFRAFAISDGPEPLRLHCTHPGSVYRGRTALVDARGLGLRGSPRRAGAVNEHTDEDGPTVFAHACRFGFEGIVSKRVTAPYRSGPSRDWLKVKNPDGPAMIRAREGR
jgi:hypothetical protein